MGVGMGLRDLSHGIWLRAAIAGVTFGLAAAIGLCRRAERPPEGSD